jgi:type I restriction enzyme R subunit/putative DNA methylase
MSGSHPGWHSRGYLPHFDPGSLIQSITFRLADSLPKSRLLELQNQIPKSQSAAKRAKIEEWLNQGAGNCILSRTDCAKLVQEQLQFFDGQRYRLLAWCVMPNHVHCLLHIYEGYPLSKTLQSIKSYSGRRINELLKSSGPVWEPEYFDRFIRDADHFTTEVQYIENNPVAAGLCKQPEDWPFSSAQWRLSGNVPQVPG